MKIDLTGKYLRYTSLVLAGLFSAYALFISGARADGPPATVTFSTGQVTITRAQNRGTVAGAVGASVNQDDTIQTGASSRVRLNYRGTEIWLGQNSRMTVENILNEALPVRVNVQQGFGWFNVRNNANRGFVATTPTAVASVRGTKFSIGGDAQGSVLCVCEGTVATASAARPTAVTNLSAGGSHAYNASGQLTVSDFNRYFRRMKVDQSFKAEISRDAHLGSCLTCHRMVNLATDTTPDEEYVPPP